MKSYKRVALAAILSTFTLQTPLFSGNTTSSVTSSALTPFMPAPLPMCKSSLALVPLMPLQKQSQNTFETCSATDISTPPLNLAAYFSYMHDMHKICRGYAYFVAQQYKARNITKKRVKQAVKGDFQRRVLNGTILKQEACEIPDLAEFYGSVLAKNGSVITEFTDLAKKAGVALPTPQRTRR